MLMVDYRMFRHTHYLQICIIKRFKCFEMISTTWVIKWINTSFFLFFLTHYTQKWYIHWTFQKTEEVWLYISSHKITKNKKHFFSACKKGAVTTSWVACKGIKTDSQNLTLVRHYQENVKWFNYLSLPRCWCDVSGSTHIQFKNICNSKKIKIKKRCEGFFRNKPDHLI